MFRSKASTRCFLLLLACMITGLGSSALFADTLERYGWEDRYIKHKVCGGYFVGFDMQQIASNTNIDYEHELELLSDYDINHIRIWLYTPWFGTDGPGRDVLHPWRVVEVGRKRKFDIDNWDPEYWDRLKKVVAYAREKGIVIQVSLFSIQEPFRYFRKDSTFSGSKIEYAFQKNDNIQRFGRPTPDGDFYPSFFDLDYKEKGKYLQDYQKALIEKAITELEEYDNVHFELMNEGPGPSEAAKDPYYFEWAEEMLSYIKSLTTKLVSISTEGFIHMSGPQADFDELVSRVSNNMDVDGQSFHLYSDDPNEMSDRLHSFQSQGQLLLGNEGGEYYDVDRSPGYPNFIVDRNTTKLLKEIRHGWGYVTAGGYFLAYKGPDTTGSDIWQEMASALQAMRNIVETVEFSEMRPIRDDGSEYDDVVAQGPLDKRNWQVLANEGQQYLIYFWGTDEKAINPEGEPAISSDVEASVSDDEALGDEVLEVDSDASRREESTLLEPPIQDTVLTDLPPGRYTYKWYDTRLLRKPLLSGQVSGDGHLVVPSPLTDWVPAAGIVLTVSKRPDDDISSNIEED